MELDSEQSDYSAAGGKAKLQQASQKSAASAGTRVDAEESGHNYLDGR